jgi:hypothetical protein
MIGPGAQEQLVRFAKLGVPAISLLALHFAGWSGLAAGALLALAHCLYAILFGVERALQAAPAPFLRGLVLSGLAVAAAGGAWSAAAPEPGSISAALLQLGLASVVAAAGSLVFLAIAGRAGAIGRAS